MKTIYVIGWYDSALKTIMTATTAVSSSADTLYNQYTDQHVVLVKVDKRPDVNGTVVRVYRAVAAKVAESIVSKVN